MNTTYHLPSAQDINMDLLNAIKSIYKSSPITIKVEDEGENFEISAAMASILDERLTEDEKDYITADESILQLKMKYGL
jgi:hypothetical protein